MTVRGLHLGRHQSRDYLNHPSNYLQTMNHSASAIIHSKTIEIREQNIITSESSLSKNGSLPNS